MQFKNANKINGFKHISHGMAVKTIFSGRSGKNGDDGDVEGEIVGRVTAGIHQPGQDFVDGIKRNLRRDE